MFYLRGLGASPAYGPAGAAARAGSFSVGQQEILNRMELKATQKTEVQEKGLSD